MCLWPLVHRREVERSEREQQVPRWHSYYDTVLQRGLWVGGEREERMTHQDALQTSGGLGRRRCPFAGPESASPDRRWLRAGAPQSFPESERWKEGAAVHWSMDRGGPKNNKKSLHNFQEPQSASEHSKHQSRSITTTAIVLERLQFSSSSLSAVDG